MCDGCIIVKEVVTSTTRCFREQRALLATNGIILKYSVESKRSAKDEVWQSPRDTAGSLQ